MRVTHLRLLRFRNYDRLDWRPGPGVNLLLGANAQGKTNLLEAVGLLLRGRSGRLRRKETILQWQAPLCRLEGELLSEQGLSARVSLEVSRSGRRKIEKDGQRINRTSLIFAAFPSVVQWVEDVEILTGAPALRRGLLDTLCFQLFGEYLRRYASFEKLLLSRNVLLKRGERGRTLSVLTEQYLEEASAVLELRLEATALLMECLEEIRPATGEDLSLVYRMDGERAGAPPGRVELRDLLGTRLSHREASSRNVMTTEVGPHRDDLEIHIDGREVRSTASRGQLREAMFKVRLGEWRALQRRREESPVLLLDDVFAEADGARRARMAGMLPRGAQCFITGTDPTMRDFFKEREWVSHRIEAGEVGGER